MISAEKPQMLQKTVPGIMQTRREEKPTVTGPNAGATERLRRVSIAVLRKNKNGGIDGNRTADSAERKAENEKTLLRRINKNKCSALCGIFGPPC